MALTNIPVLNLTVQATDGLHISTELLYPQQELIKTPLALQTTKTPKSQGFFDHHIFIALHYPDFNPPNGRRGFLTGPKNDFGLLIEQFGYENKDKFTCINDFDHRRPNGEIIPKTKATKKAILDRIRLAMQQRKPGERVLWHYAGHTSDGKAIIASDWKGISGRELLNCLTKDVDPNVAITFVSDSCGSDVSLGLPYKYQENANSNCLEVEISQLATIMELFLRLRLREIVRQLRSQKLPANPILQISGSPAGKSSFSVDFSDGSYNGLLTHHFVRYFQKNDSESQIGDIMHFINKRFDETGRLIRNPEDQKPCFSSSVDLTESFPCF